MTTYRVATVYPTVQGEGVQTGVPMVLVRLQGCGVGCPWCDTKETWDARGGRVATAEEIAAEAAGHHGPTWALLTGGEPAEQPLADLVAALHGVGFHVALETSGTADGHVGVDFDWVCVSPKIGMPGGKPILRAAVATADEIKMVIGKPADLAALDRFLAEFGPFRPGVTVCLQPVSRSETATRLCIEAATRRGWRLSVQTHALIGLP